MKKSRLDDLVCELGLAPNIQIARSLILQGKVIVDDHKIIKANHLVHPDSNVRIKGGEHNYVSRGALKLLKALSHFNVNVTDLVCMDVGSSTGGFTEVLLNHGAKIVYAVDVGYNELAYKLRIDPRVTVLERTNARFLTEQQINIKPDLIVCDASFISLKTVLPTPISLAKRDVEIIVLIKPQFEAKIEEVGPGGIIRDPQVHIRICNEIKDWVFAQGFEKILITESPILGMKGNKEFLVYAKKNLHTQNDF